MGQQSFPSNSICSCTNKCILSINISKLIKELQNDKSGKGFMDIMESKAPVQAGSEQTGLGPVLDTSKDGDSSTSGKHCSAQSP